MVDEQTYDVKFQFQEYYLWANKVTHDDYTIMKSAFARKEIFDVTTNNASYTINPAMLAYMEVRESRPF